MYEFITDEMYESALALGISKRNVNNRYFNCGWPLEEALTKPVGESNESKYSAEMMELAKSNGVSPHRFRKRVRDGMSELEAASTPVLSKAEAAKKNQAKRWRVDPTHRQLAEANGIPYITFYKRIAHSQWDSYLAATVPILRRAEVTQQKREKQWRNNPQHLELAKANGIPYGVFYKRVTHSKWDSYIAATTPVKRKGERKA